MSDVDSIKNLINGDSSDDELQRLIEEGERLISELIYTQKESVVRMIEKLLSQPIPVHTFSDVKWELEDHDFSRTFPDAGLRENFTDFFSTLSPFLGLMRQLDAAKKRESDEEIPCEVRSAMEALLQSFEQSEMKESLVKQLAAFPGKSVVLALEDDEIRVRLCTSGTPRECFWDIFGFLERHWRSFDSDSPPSMTSWLLDSLKYLKEAYRPKYERDEDALDYAYFSAAYALFLVKRDGSYSDDSIKAFEESFRAYFSVYYDIGAKPVMDKPKDWEVRSQVALQAIVGMHLFRIRVGELDWPETFRMYAHALACHDAVTGADYDQVLEAEFFKEGWWGAERYVISDEWESYEATMHQEAQKAFKGIENVHVTDLQWPEVSKQVQMIIRALQADRLAEGPEFLVYWARVEGWLRGSKLEPGELRDDLRREEDEKAEQRLKRYFFDGAQWGALPERARSSLVEADRVWYSHRLGNPGAVLEHIKIAVEEVMHDLLWEPCYQWIDNERLSSFEVVDLVEMRKQLKKDRKDPSLLEFESAVESKGLTSWLKTLDISDGDRNFVLRLRKPLQSLRQARKQVVHGVGGPTLTRGQVAPLYRTFMGLGQEGILPRLARIKADLERRDSLPTLRG